MSYQVDTSYKVRRAFKVGGLTALVKKKRCPEGLHPRTAWLWSLRNRYWLCA